MKLSESARKYLFLIVATISVFLFDWLTPVEVSVGPVYLLLVGYTRWQLGLKPAIAMCFVSPALWALADYEDGHRFHHIWILFENIGVRVFTHSMVVAAVSLYKRTLEAHRRRLAMLERLLSVCPGCGAIGVNEGGWRKASEFHDSPPELYTLCPTCAAAHQPDVPADTPRAAHG